MKKNHEMLFYVSLLIVFNLIYCFIKDDFYYLICYDVIFISVLLLKQNLFRSKVAKLLLITIIILTIIFYFYTLR